MADGNKNSGSSTPNGGAAEVELEAMRKNDFSWHPCKVSLCSNGVGLMVEYSNDILDPDDIILSTEEAVARLRIRSTPLEGVACSTVQQGDRVLAKRNPVNLFFDAEVIKVVRIRHSKKIHCRCTFMVKWIHNGLEGETAIIPSPALMKMSTESIHVHPTIFAFFNILLTSSCCYVSPLRVLGEGVDSEMDNIELEKQIEQISNSADASRMKVTEKVMSEEVDIQEQSQCNSIAASEVRDASIQLPPFLDCIRGSTRQAQCNFPVEMEVKHPPPPSPFAQEGITESKPPCNPIAACAALASLMSESSESTEILSAKDVKGYVPPPNITNSLIAMKSSEGSTPQTISFPNNSSKTNDEYSLGTETATATFVSKYESIVKELFPTKKPPREPKILDASSEASKWESKNEISSQEVASWVGNYVSSTTKKKMDLPTGRSSPLKSSCENVEMPLTNARRLTRSVVREIKEKQTVETKNATKEILSTTFEQKLSVQERNLLPDKETVASVIVNESGLTISDNFKNQMERGTCENNVSEMKTNGRGKQALNNSRRLTCSTVNEKTQKKNEQPRKGLEECSSLEHTKSDLGGNISSESKSPDLEKAISLSLAHEIYPNPSAEGYKEVQFSASMKTAKKPEENATSNTIRSQGLKRKSVNSKKQELRSSPRLRFLPRTRSQTKS